MGTLEDLREYAQLYNTAPTVETMPRRTLEQKGIYGPTGAHVIEEIHTPFNLAYITVTTGTTAFQNIVGVTYSELAERVRASRKALELAGVQPGQHILFTYPPLVNVFTREGLDAYGMTTSFLQSSSRDALILALAETKPAVVVGESSFLRAALEDARRMGLEDQLPQGLNLITAGTPLDLELPEVAQRLGGTVHDLYGAQEFGWLTLDGIPLREDVTMIPVEGSDAADCIVGGLPTGDSFPVLEAGHICNRGGKIITYSRARTDPDYETTVLATTAAARETVVRAAKTILRIKAKIVRVADDLAVGADHTVLSLTRYGSGLPPVIIDTPKKTQLFDAMLKAQLDYQSQSKTDPTWIKER